MLLDKEPTGSAFGSGRPPPQPDLLALWGCIDGKLRFFRQGRESEGYGTETEVGVEAVKHEIEKILRGQYELRVQTDDEDEDQHELRAAELFGGGVVGGAEVEESSEEESELSSDNIIHPLKKDANKNPPLKKGVKNPPPPPAPKPNLEPAKANKRPAASKMAAGGESESSDDDDEESSDAPAHAEAAAHARVLLRFFEPAPPCFFSLVLLETRTARSRFSIQSSQKVFMIIQIRIAPNNVNNVFVLLMNQSAICHHSRNRFILEI